MRAIGETYTTVDASLITTAELVVASLNLKGARAGQRVLLLGHAVVTPGTTTTGIVVRLNRGVLGGNTFPGTDNFTEGVTAAVSHAITIVLLINVVDEDGAVNLSLQQVAATANGTVLFSSLVAFLLD